MTIAERIDSIASYRATYRDLLERRNLARDRNDRYAVQYLNHMLLETAERITRLSVGS